MVDNSWKVQETKKAKQRYKEYKRNKKPNIVVIIGILLMMIIVVIVGFLLCFHDNTPEERGEFSDGDLTIEKAANQEAEIEVPKELDEITTGTENMSDEEVQEMVDAYINRMNLEAKVGQLFYITPEELTGIGIAVQAGETTKTMLKTYYVGGMIFTEQNFEVLDQMKLMLSNIKVYSSYPIFLAMDEVGAVRITNTNDTLEETGFNMASIDSELYLLTEDGQQSVNSELNIVSLDGGNAVDLVNGEADMILVDDGFSSAYDSVVSAVRSGEIDESVLEEKVRKILTYKVENEI